MNKKNKQEEEQRYKAPRMQVFGLSVHSCIAASWFNESYETQSGLYDNDDNEGLINDKGEW